MADADFDSSVRLALSLLRNTPIGELKDEQKEALVHLLNGEDVFGVLPTGYGKSLIYEIVPKLFPICRQKKVGTSDFEMAASVIVVSPLISLMKDQVEEMRQLGLESEYLSSEHELTEPELQKLKLGKYDVVLASPESWLGKYRYLFDIEEFRKNICLLVADEAHVIPQWGLNQKRKKAFRGAFSQLRELRALVRKDIPFLALTATANKRTRRKITQTLLLRNPHYIIRSPKRENIFIGVKKAQGVQDLDWLVEQLGEERLNMRRTLLYCRAVKDAVSVYEQFLNLLGERSYVDDTSKLSGNRLFALYHHNTDDKRKENVLKDLITDSGHFRVVICTNALGMGINVPNISTVIHYGVPSTTESYIQEIGRAGRDGKEAQALLYYCARHLLATEKEMKDFVRGKEQCRKKQLFKEFGEVNEGDHRCCDICLEKWKRSSMEPEAPSHGPLAPDPHTAVREPSNEDLKVMVDCLSESQDKCRHLNVLGINFFPDLLVNEIIASTRYIDSYDYVITNLSVIHPLVAVEIVTVLNEVFGEELPVPTVDDVILDDIDDLVLQLVFNHEDEEEDSFADLLDEYAESH